MKFNKPFDAKFKIKQVHKEDSYYVELLETKGYDTEITECNLFGKFKKAYVGDIFACQCEFVRNKNLSYVLKMLTVPVIEIPATQIELVKFSAAQMSGVSRETMSRVVNVLGNEFIDTIVKDKEALEGIGLKDSQKNTIRTWCENHQSLGFLMGNGYLKTLMPDEIIRIYKGYSADTLKIINEDPFSLYLFGYVGYKRAKTIADKDKLPSNDNRRLSALIFNLIETEEDNGSMAISEDFLIKEVAKKNFSKEEFNKAINYLISDKLIDKEELDKLYYGKTNNIRAERNIAKYLLKVKDKPMYTEKQIDEAYKGNELNKQQKESAYGVLQNKFSILTGGPGTGKTYTIKRIIRTVKNINSNANILLLAPTGKAASRMTEMIGKDAQTIHSALGISEDDNLDEKEGMKLDYDLIVIDEASMIDEKLFAYFCKHIEERTQVILVGDTGQLPSVEAGNLLDQLSKIVPVFELTQICRQDKTSPIVLNAHHIRNKEFNEIQFDNNDFQFIETDDVVNTVGSLYKEFTNFETMPEDIMILSPQHNRNGTKQINERIRELNTEEVVGTFNKISYKRGDRVIQLKNTKKLGIHNGDQGEVIGATEKSLWVQFDNIDEPVEITDFKNIEFSYAITVHKSQGSEADIIIMIFNKGHAFTLTNKLIYTALTRTKNRFIGIGNKEMFFRGCQKEDFSRISLIKQIYDKYSLLALEEEEC